MSVPRTDADPRQGLIDSVDFWWRSIDLGDGLVTPGRKSAAWLKRELAALQLPDLQGKSVLDIGAWDGYYSFAAERLGARRVLALDHYVWSLDRNRATDYHARHADAAAPAAPPIEQTDAWQPHTLPGKRGFDAAHAALGSKVEAMVGDFMTLPAETIGTFDVVLFLGVLYHMENPLAALRKLRTLTGEMAVIETHAVALPAYEHRALCEFYPNGELDGDVSNWWGPNLAALRALCLAAGFRRVEVKQGAPRKSALHEALRRLHLFASGARTRRPRYYRAIVHAYK